MCAKYQTRQLMFVPLDSTVQIRLLLVTFSLLIQTDDSEIDVDDDDEDDEEEEEEESKDLEDDSLEGPLSRTNRPLIGVGRPTSLEESDDF